MRTPVDLGSCGALYCRLQSGRCLVLYQAATGASEVSARIRGGGARGWALGLYVSVGADASSLQRQHVRACVCVCARAE